ncbi:MAG: response regulator, partial [Blastochloris sp.]|nr:response regulator [Blastochloris sp.]
ILADLPMPAGQPVLVLATQEQDGAALHAYLRRHGFATEVVQIHPDAPDLPAMPIVPGAVIVDAQLAAHGWNIVRSIQTQPATADVPVLFYALSPQQNSGALLDLEHAIKPLHSEQFTQALERHSFGDSAHKTLLVVDDDPDIRAMHVRVAQSHSTRLQVLQAENGVAALTAMRATRPDLVLLDLMMPKLDGFGVLEAMRADTDLRDIPVIVLTAQTLSEADIARLNTGVRAFAEGHFHH